MKQNFLSRAVFFCLFFLTFILSGCQTKILQEKSKCSIHIDASGVKSEKQLVEFFARKNPSGDIARAKRLASFYVEQAKYEGINSDVAFVQMCLETGFLKFGLLVTPDMNNFCGLGAIDAKNRGLSFATEEEGVIAHIQHLHAYGTTRNLNGKLIDSRYKYVNPITNI